MCCATSCTEALAVSFSLCSYIGLDRPSVKVGGHRPVRPRASQKGNLSFLGPSMVASRVAWFLYARHWDGLQSDRLTSVRQPSNPAPATTY